MTRPSRNPLALQRRAKALLEASDATVVELRGGGAVVVVHAGCASASAALGLAALPAGLDADWEVANDNAVPSALRDVADAALRAGDATRSTVTLAGLDHDVCVVPRATGDALCVLRPSRFAPAAAHDLNGCLAAAMLSAEALVADPSLTDAARAAAREIAEAARRAGVLTTQLLAGARLASHGERFIDVASEFEALVPLLRRSLPPGVRLEAEAAPDAPCAQVDAVLFQRVLMNLVASAGEAVAGGGTVTVRAWGDGDGGPVDRCVLEVADDGPGLVDAAGRASPRPGGLAAVRALVEQAGAVMEVESEPGRGTRVTVSVPAFVPRMSALWPAEATAGASERAGG